MGALGGKGGSKGRGGRVRGRVRGWVKEGRWEGGRVRVGG